MDSDQDFLIELFQSTRPDIMAVEHLPLAQREELILTQFRAQSTDYQMRFPKAEKGIICYGNQPIGRLYLNRQSDEVRLVDISIMPEFRGQGIGQILLVAVQQEAKMQQKVVKLHVEKMNRAHQFYLRNGFQQIGETPTHFEMKWDANSEQIITSD